MDRYIVEHAVGATGWIVKDTLDDKPITYYAAESSAIQRRAQFMADMLNGKVHK